MKLIVKPAARSDILEQLLYYTDAGGDDVGDRFFVGIRQSLSAITQARWLDRPVISITRPSMA